MVYLLCVIVGIAIGYVAPKLFGKAETEVSTIESDVRKRL